MDSRMGYLLLVRGGPGAVPDLESCWEAAVAAACKSPRCSVTVTPRQGPEQRLIELTEYMQQAIDSGLERLDFNTDEVISIKRESIPWPANPTAQNDLWNRRLKSQVLRMKLNDKDLVEIGETLSKRYRNQQKIALRNRSEDAFQTFINACAATFDPHTQYFSPRTSINFNINIFKLAISTRLYLS